MSSEELDTLNAIQNQRPHAPFRKLEFAPVNIALTAREDGSQLLINQQPLAPPAGSADWRILALARPEPT